MNWVFQYGREWTSPSKIKADCYWPYDCYWLIQVLENGSFLVSGPVKKREEFSTLQRAKDFCEMQELELRLSANG